jgi:hypothetical protein
MSNTAFVHSFPFRGKVGMGVGYIGYRPHPHPSPLLRFKCSLALQGIRIYTSQRNPLAPLAGRACVAGEGPGGGEGQGASPTLTPTLSRPKAGEGAVTWRCVDTYAFKGRE